NCVIDLSRGTGDLKRRRLRWRRATSLQVSLFGAFAQSLECILASVRQRTRVSFLPRGRSWTSARFRSYRRGSMVRRSNRYLARRRVQSWVGRSLISFGHVTLAGGNSGGGGAPALVVC